jgi:hypothetical protein
MHRILIHGGCCWLPVPVSQFEDQVSLGEYRGTVLPMSHDSFSPCTARAWDLSRSQLGLVQFPAMISGCRLLGANHGNCSTQQASLFNCTIYKWLSCLLQALFQAGLRIYIYSYMSNLVLLQLSTINKCKAWREAAGSVQVCNEDIYLLLWLRFHVYTNTYVSELVMNRGRGLLAASTIKLIKV